MMRPFDAAIHYHHRESTGSANNVLSTLACLSNQSDKAAQVAQFRGELQPGS